MSLKLFLLGHYAVAFPLSAPAGSKAKLSTATFTGGKERCLQFAYNMNDESRNNEMGSLRVSVTSLVCLFLSLKENSLAT